MTIRRTPVLLVLAATLVLSACASPTATRAPSVSTQPPAPSMSVATQAPGPHAVLAPKGQTRSGLAVDRVVDGDTIRVLLDGRSVSVRLIGINTPETVKPDWPVECFGPESSDFAKAMLTGRRVTLEFDASQGAVDQYDRVLAYVWREEDDGTLSLFNLAAVAGGYAYERQYGSTPYAWRPEFVSAQNAARAAGRGLWSACPASNG